MVSVTRKSPGSYRILMTDGSLLASTHAEGQCPPRVLFSAWFLSASEWWGCELSGVWDREAEVQRW